MSFKLILVGAAALLAASPSFAATKHHHQRARHHAAGTEAVPEHSGPIPYAELAAVDAQMNRTGYDARPSHRHRRRCWACR